MLSPNKIQSTVNCRVSYADPGVVQEVQACPVVDSRHRQYIEDEILGRSRIDSYQRNGDKRLTQNQGGKGGTVYRRECQARDVLDSLVASRQWKEGAKIVDRNSGIRDVRSNARRSHRHGSWGSLPCKPAAVAVVDAPSS